MSEPPFDGYSDAEVVAILHKHEFQGPIWDRFVEYVCSHGMSVITPWIRSKRIFAEMRLRRIRCCGAVVIDDQSAGDLAADTAVRAIGPFRAMLKSGRWDPHGPATLATAFITGCLQQFPNVYRTWLRQKFGTGLEKLELMPGTDEVAGLIEEQARERPLWAPFGGDPEKVVITRERLEELLALLPDDLRAVIQLVSKGYTFTEAAASLGKDPKQLMRRLYKIRPWLLQLWGERDKDSD
jgi:DNA-directed RNA polymerase specialized sigma24 family protein